MTTDKSSVPIAQFRVINDKSNASHIEDSSFSQFGYNTIVDIYKQSNAYVRYIEPLDVDLTRQVEYDMDEQDKEWLDDLNTFRAELHVEAVTYELFEIIIDRLEKEYLNLQKKLPTSHTKAHFSEDSTCVICNDSECDNSNAIVFCDGCNLAVHQDCYGIPYIPEGQWLCRKCTVSPENPVSCVLCPNEGGAFKQTNSGAWAHVLCANWIPETGLANPVYQEPVEGIDKIPKSRWKLNCYICKEKMGACIQCDDRSCFVAMHPTCAKNFGLLCKTKNLPDDQTIIMRALCHRHRPKTIKSAPLFDADKDSTVIPMQVKSSTKAARAHSHNFNPGPPLCPQYVIERILDAIDAIDISYKQEIVYEVTKYWALKREKRRGAGLIRRLHLEPWSATLSSQHSEADKRQKMEYMVSIKEDLERARQLVEKLLEREAAKHEQTNHVIETICNFFYPFDKQLRLVFEKIVALDTDDIFAEQVSTLDAPDYYEIIKHPRSWSFIYSKIDTKSYKHKDEFLADINLVYDNAMEYNMPDSVIYYAAQKQKELAKQILEESLSEITTFEQDSKVIEVLRDEQGIEKLYDTSLFQEPEQAEEIVAKPPKRRRRSSRAPKKSKRKNKPYDREEAKATLQERQQRQAAIADEQLKDIIDSGGGERSLRSSYRDLKPEEKDTSVERSRKEESIDVSEQQSEVRSPSKEVQKTPLSKAFKKEKDSQRVKEEESTAEPIDEVNNQENDLGTSTNLRRSKRRSSVTKEPSQSRESSLSVVPQSEEPEEPPQTNEANNKKRKGDTDDKGSSKPKKIARKNKPKPRESTKTNEKRTAPPTRSTDFTSGSLGEFVILRSFTTNKKAVWAKLEKYPHFPSEIYDVDDDEDAEVVPENVMKARPKSKFVIYLVKFFDSKRTWAWVPRHNIVSLGWDDVDQQYLERKLFKGVREWESTKAAYRRAMSSLID